MHADDRSHRSVRTLAQGGLGFIEGPVFGADGTLYVTSITQGGIYRIGEDGAVSLFADTNGGGNGATAAADGGLLLAQNGGRRMWDGPVFPPATTGIQRIDPDGTIRWISQDPISPNDLRLGPDGLLYVTDPTRSLALDDGRLWRIHPETGDAELLVSVPWFPNGITFGPDERLYVGDTGQGVVYAAEIGEDGVLGPLEPVITLAHGHPDGIAFDANGDLVICAVELEGEPGTVQTWTLAGEQVDEFGLGRGSFPTNLSFLPDGSDTVIITFADLEEIVVVEHWGVGGLLPHPFRTR